MLFNYHVLLLAFMVSCYLQEPYIPDPPEYEKMSTNIAVYVI